MTEHRRPEVLVFIVAILLIAIGGSSTAATLCVKDQVGFGYFNGVKTTPLEAEFTLSQLKRKYGLSGPQGAPIRYELFYNQSKGFEDFVEVFEQRMGEQNGLLAGRYELFLQAWRGGSGWWDKLKTAVPATGDVLAGLVGWVGAKTLQAMTTLVGSPPTAFELAEHRARVDNLLLEGRALLLVAHSQGNLFVNAAYHYARTKVPAQSVKVVHIAPASPQVSGPHTLADMDLVINGLRATGRVPANTDAIPVFGSRLPGLNGKTDFLGHGLLEIYLNPTLTTSTRIDQQVKDALATLVPPEQKASPGFFTATLTWDGPGDADLHVIEPDGGKVMYARKAGAVGVLDVDNTTAHGPEHYYASCDATRLRAGRYRVGVANFFYADGRRATLQIATASEGVLGTRTIVLGPRGGDVVQEFPFTVVVSKDEKSGRWRARLDAP